jgi:hypothetical protein
MRPLALLLLLSLTTAPSRALDVGAEPPEAFVLRSKGDPGRLYALVVGATWCEPCHRLAAQLAEAPASSATALGRAAWDKVETDAYGTAKFGRFLADAGSDEQDAIPYVLVFWGGAAVGYTTPGEDLASIDRYLAETELRPSVRAKGTAPRLVCPGRKDDASFTLGISGMLSARDRSTDRFGVMSLLAFGSGPSLLLAPSTGTSVASEPAETGTGVFFVEDALAADAKRIQSAAISTTALANFPSAPGTRLRLVLAGHGGPQGLMISARPYPGFDLEIAGIMEPIHLTEPQVTAAVSAARRGGKSVRGLVLTCFGGQFGESFMPFSGAAAPACAAFATLPEKTAEGCYSDRANQPMRDYLTVASRGLECSRPVDGRARHYAVALATSSRDVPMLSSEYFLLYGPGAAYLGRGERAPAPSRGVGRFDFADKVSVYVDLIGGNVLAARRDGRPVSAPRLSVEDCRTHRYAQYSLDGKHAVGSFFLRGRVSGADAVERSDCSPVVSLRWDPEDGEDIPEATADLDAPSSVYAPTREGDWNRSSDREIAQALAPEGPTVSTRGLKREARALMAAVLPAFGEPLAGAALEARLKETAARLRPDDAPLADALAAMASIARVDARKRRADLRSTAPAAAPLPDLVDDDELRRALAASNGEKSAAKPAAPKEPDPGAFTADDLVKAMWRNVGPGDYDSYEDISLFRLAHLAAAAQAELALRREAASSPKARKLVSQLESLQNCERGLY